MSVTDEPLDPIDEAASALVDGSYDGPVTPEIEARAASFRRVAAAVAAPVDVDAAAREDAIAAALATFSPAPAAAVPLRRPVSSVRWLRPLAAAAAVVAAVAIGAAAIGSGDGDHDDMATAADSAAESAGRDETATALIDETTSEAPAEGDAGGTGAGTGAGGQASSTGGADGVGLLGSYETYDDLVAAAQTEAAIRSSADTGGSPTTVPGSGPATTTVPPVPTSQFAGMHCPAPAGFVRLATTAQLAGQPVEVWVTVADDGTETVTVYDADCVLFER